MLQLDVPRGQTKTAVRPRASFLLFLRCFGLGVAFAAAFGMFAPAHSLVNTSARLLVSDARLILTSTQSECQWSPGMCCRGAIALFLGRVRLPPGHPLLSGHRLGTDTTRSCTHINPTMTLTHTMHPLHKHAYAYPKCPPSPCANTPSPPLPTPTAHTSSKPHSPTHTTCRLHALSIICACVWGA